MTTLRPILPALLLATALLMSCASGKGSGDDTGTDVVDDQVVSDVTGDQEDTVAPPPQGPTRAALSSGGGPRASETFQLQVTVGSPVSSQSLASKNYRLRVGVGPFVARPR